MDTHSVASPLLLSLKVASLATCAAFVAGVGLAYVLSRRRFPGAAWLDAGLTLPLVLPPTIVGYLLIVVLGRRGLLGSWLDQTLGISLMFTWQGAVVAAAVVAFPLVFTSARAAFDGVDPLLVDAARDLGGSSWAVFRLVAMPLAWKGILAGTMLAFARAMGEFGATLMVAGNLPGRTQTLPLAIYDAVQSGRADLAAGLVILTSLACTAILVASGKLLNR